MGAGTLLERRTVLSVDFDGHSATPIDHDLYRLTLYGEPLIEVWLHEDPFILPLPGQVLGVEWATWGEGEWVQPVAVCLHVYLEGLDTTLTYKWLPWRRLEAGVGEGEDHAEQDIAA